MKNILIAALIVLPVSIMAQVKTMHRPPETNNNLQIIEPAVQISANLVKVVLVCNTHNLSGKYTPVVNYIPTLDYFSEVIIDNTLTNNNPDAFIIVTPVRTNPSPLSVFYDQAIQKWKIKIDTNGQDDITYGLATPTTRGPNMESVLPYKPGYLKAGDKFNILINQ